MSKEIEIKNKEISFTHSKNLEKAIELLPPDELICDLSDFYKLFADSTRLKILCLLKGGEMCVCDIADSLNMTSSAISHQLKALRLYKLIKSSRSGKTVYYSLADSHVSKIITQGLDHLTEPEDIQENI